MSSYDFQWNHKRNQMKTKTKTKTVMHFLISLLKRNNKKNQQQSKLKIGTMEKQ